MHSDAKKIRFSWIFELKNSAITNSTSVSPAHHRGYGPKKWVHFFRYIYFPLIFLLLPLNRLPKKKRRSSQTLIFTWFCKLLLLVYPFSRGRERLELPVNGFLETARPAHWDDFLYKNIVFYNIVFF
jgi:hypothetical protein